MVRTLYQSASVASLSRHLGQRSGMTPERLALPPAAALVWACSFLDREDPQAADSDFGDV